VPRGRKDAHVGADLSDHDFGGSLCDAGDAGRQLDAGGCLRVQLQMLADGLRDSVDLLVEEVQVSEDRSDHDGVVGLEAALQRLAQRGDLGAEFAAGEIGEDVGVGRSRDERVEHRAARRAEDVGGDAVQFDVGVFQRLVQPVGLALALGDLRLAIARQRPQLTLGFGRHEAGSQQPGLHELGQPLRVRDVGLAARDLLDVARVAQRQLKVFFQDVPDRLPVGAGGLHRHMRDLMGG
jgi:hypothetical protein